MKLSIAQINPIVGDIEYNKNLIIDAIQKGKLEQSDLVVFPEMSLVGYPLNDLVYQSDFLEKQTSAIEEIAHASEKIAVAFGFVEETETRTFDNNVSRYNSLLIIQNQKIVGKQQKSLLPNYDVFHENRYFKPAESIEPISLKINGETKKIGFQVCEDLWDEFYDKKVSKILVEKGAEILINCSASPFEIDKYKEREERVKNYATSLNVPFVYCNMVGGQDELIFDGNSFIYDRNGKLCTSLSGFESDFKTLDMNDLTPTNVSKKDDYELLYLSLVLGVKDYFYKSRMRKCVLGLSGGVDSALVAAIASEALGAENTLTISMPSKYSSDHSKDDAKKLAENYGMTYKVCPLEDLHKSFESNYPSWFPNQSVGLTDENVQARLRGMILMAHSNQEGRMLLTTGNKTEIALGYCTLYGDMNGALAVIGDLSKHRVFELCRYINKRFDKEMIPTNIIDKKPSAELRPDQFDPFDYEKVSPLVDEMIEGKKSKKELCAMGFDEETVSDMLSKFYFSEFKRFQSAIILKVTSKAFGYGRVFPITNRFRG